MPLLGISTWTDADGADDAVATAQRAGVVGRRHYITAVSASYSGAVVGNLELRSAATRIFFVDVNGVGGVHLTFPFPLECASGAAAVAILSASGAPGTMGDVSIAGFTA